MNCNDIETELKNLKTELKELGARPRIDPNEDDGTGRLGRGQNGNEISSQAFERNQLVQQIATKTHELANCRQVNDPSPDSKRASTKPSIVQKSNKVSKTKVISLGFLQQKFDEIFNKRQDPPILKIRLHNNGFKEEIDAIESNIEVFFIDAGKADGYDSKHKGPIKDIVDWRQSYYFNDINSDLVTLNVTPEKQTLLELKINFETNNTGPDDNTDTEMPNYAHVLQNLDFLRFSITLRFTFSLTDGKIDLMSWVNDINQLKFTPRESSYTVSGQFLGKPVLPPTWQAIPSLYISSLIDQVIEVDLATSNTLEPGGNVKDKFRDGIYSNFITPDPNNHDKTGRDSFNDLANKWLLGGDGEYTVTNLTGSGNNLIITYEVPEDVLNPGFTNAGPPNKPGIQPPTPDWPNEVTNPDSIFDFSPGTLSNIDHIVVVTMENRSFDHMLGYLSLPIHKGGMGRKDVDGLKGGESNTYGITPHPSFPINPGDTRFTPDPPHHYEPVRNAINDGKMDGFAESYGRILDDADAAKVGNIMGYHTGINVPVYDALVRDFSIGQRWFSSHPGPTFSNRFYELTGRLNITSKFSKQDKNLDESTAAGYWEYSNSNPLAPVFTKTIFDALDEYNHEFGGATWNYFEEGYCFLRFFENYTFNNENIVNISDPERGFFAKAQNGTLASVSFIDPHFIELPPNANCDGAPADIKDGQLFIEKIVDAVITGPKWEKTLLIIIYDEHGGFYDHVAPPQAPKFADDSAEYPLGSYGVRVPAFVVSPWVNQGEVFGYDGTPGRVSNLYFDHTSIMKTIARRFMSGFPPYMGRRYAYANDLSMVLTDTLRQSQFLPFVSYYIRSKSLGKVFDIQGGQIEPGTLLWQFNLNKTDSQKFSFEDAGEGLSYIRTHRGNNYLTVSIVSHQVDTNTTGGTSEGLGIVQDVKYITTTIPRPDLPEPAEQKWTFIPTEEPFTYLITNQNHPNMALQSIHIDSGSGEPIRLMPLNGADDQKWLIDLLKNFIE